MGSELIQTTGVPHWLQPPKKDGGEFYTEWVWEHALERCTAGETLTSICRDAHMPDIERFRRWIFADPQRKARYYEAREAGAEKIEDEMLDIADGEGMEDVQRSTLRINTRKWLLGVWNRKRYGESKQIDVNHTVDITDAMRAAEERAAMLHNDRMGVVIEHQD